MKIGVLQGILQRGIGYRMLQTLAAGSGAAPAAARPLGTKWVLRSMQSGNEKTGEPSPKPGILA